MKTYSIFKNSLMAALTFCAAAVLTLGFVSCSEDADDLAAVAEQLKEEAQGTQPGDDDNSLPGGALTRQSRVGYGYNMMLDYIDEASVTEPILDYKKLVEAEQVWGTIIAQEGRSRQDLKIHSSYSIEEMSAWMTTQVTTESNFLGFSKKESKFKKVTEYEKTQSTMATGFQLTASYDNAIGDYLVGPVGSMEISFPVANEYSAGEYMVDTTIGQAVQTSVANANAIVSQYSSATDYDKLSGYKDEICNLVSYNEAAAGGGAGAQ